MKFTEAIEYHPKVGQYYISRSRARHMLEVCTMITLYIQTNIFRGSSLPFLVLPPFLTGVYA